MWSSSQKLHNETEGQKEVSISLNLLELIQSNKLLKEHDYRWWIMYLWVYSGKKYGIKDGTHLPHYIQINNNYSSINVTSEN